MFEYKAPLRDIEFVCNELLKADEHYQQFPQFAEANNELRSAILEEAAKFAENVVAPLNQIGDRQGCTLNNGEVKTPQGFKEAYQQFVESGWPGLSMPEEYGGQALPKSLDLMVSEMLGQANHSWAMYPGLTAGCRATLMAHADEETKQTYLSKLVEGRWSGTMCLTEPQCGSDLSFLSTSATPTDEGRYKLNGTKIFISSGEHDMSENIIHLVLARLPDAPAGTRGISLFLVPKFLPNTQGETGDRNSVSCGSLEHKMGIHGNATCVMNFDDATGYLIGEPHRGLKCMFSFMNTARLGTAQEGVCHAEVALQGALSYALDRETGRSLSGVQSADRPADKLIVHPDVRRMLQTIRVFAEGNRAFTHYLGQLVDLEQYAEKQQQIEAGKLLALLTPIAKGFMTETGIESANLGMQVFGGHGYISEWGMEQNLRDARISALYEGTTGIQALDLLARKILSDGGAQYAEFIKLLTDQAKQMDKEFAVPFLQKLELWQQLTQKLSKEAALDLNHMGAAAVEYLFYSGYMVLAWLWGKMGTLAKAKQKQQAFYRVKYATAQFYFQRILPRTSSLGESAIAGAESLMSIEQNDLSDLVS